MAVRSARLQSAVEYLLTYGWAILILVVVLATLFGLGVFSLGSTTPNICGLPADIGCVSAILYPTGILQINIEQATPYTINVVAIGCNDQGVPSDMALVSPPNTVTIGGNDTLSVQCYKTTGGALVPYSGPIGQSYKGYILVNYTDLGTGFTHTAQGSLIQVVK